MGSRAPEPMTVGRVAKATGLTVRTLHHYDELGLLVAGGRTEAGYRLYDQDDLRRLFHIVALRRMVIASMASISRSTEPRETRSGSAPPPARRGNDEGPAGGRALASRT
jgi:DNA-binding transcriptional MerR regulator